MILGHDTLQSLHDATLRDIRVDWGFGRAEVRLTRSSGPLLLIRADGIRRLEVPRAESWGPSASVNSVTFVDAGTLRIEMQSGDVIVVAGASFTVLLGDAVDAAIEKRIEEFLADEDPRYDWVRVAVRKHRFLPLYLGWVAAIGIRPDGTFVRWDHEDDRESVKTMSDPFHERLALVQGAKKYPELAALIPSRPSTARTCAPCSGRGTLALAPQIICECGGVGWVNDGESRGPATG